MRFREHASLIFHDDLGNVKTARCHGTWDRSVVAPDNDVDDDNTVGPSGGSPQPGIAAGPHLILPNAVARCNVIRGWHGATTTLTAKMTMTTTVTAKPMAYFEVDE